MPLTLAAFQGSRGSQQAGFPEGLGTNETSDLDKPTSPNLGRQRNIICPLVCGDHLGGLWTQEPACTPHPLQDWSYPPAAGMHLSPHLHLSLPASVPISRAGLTPPSLHTSCRQKYRGKALNPDHRAISVKPAKISFQNTDLWSRGLPFVNHTPGRPVSPRGCSQACRLCAPYLRKPSPGKKPTRDTSDQAQLKNRI